MRYIVPEYYADFRCKCGKCRASCCEGWSVTVSMNEYFRLLGMDCPPEIRRRLDAALHISPSPSPEHYAEIGKDWTGRCYMHRGDGLCALQAECGEDALPEICRMYPRSVRGGNASKMSCANSCEAVVETLARTTGPLAFSVADSDAAPETEEDARIKADVQKECILLMQDRRLPIYARLENIARRLGAEVSGKDNVGLALDALRTVAGCFTDSASAGELCECALRRYAGADAAEVFARDDEALTRRYPANSAAAENLIVNHIFYTDFPYSDRRESEQEDVVSLAAVCAFLRWALAARLASEDCDAIGATASLFRLIEHSDFDRNALVLLGSGGYITPDGISALMRLCR